MEFILALEKMEGVVGVQFRISLRGRDIGWPGRFGRAAGGSQWVLMQTANRGGGCLGVVWGGLGWSLVVLGELGRILGRNGPLDQVPEWSPATGSKAPLCSGGGGLSIGHKDLDIFPACPL